MAINFCSYSRLTLEAFPIPWTRGFYVFIALRSELYFTLYTRNLVISSSEGGVGGRRVADKCRVPRLNDYCRLEPLEANLPSKQYIASHLVSKTYTI